MERPDPSEYQPPLRWWSHAWRLVLTAGISAVVFGTSFGGESRIAQWWWMLDLVLGAVAYVLVFFRRRHPRAITATTAILGTVSGVAAGPATLALVSVATRRRWREIATLGSLSFAGAQFYSTVTDPEEPIWLTLSLNVIATAAVLAWGMYIGSRRELIWTLRHRAERAEAEQELRVAQARSNERARIAREMHDVLAHRISQISMYAGALEYREDLAPDEMRASAGVIRDRAHEALTDLRDVLGVLRDGTGERGPQPTYGDLRGLVTEAQEAGMRVELDDLVDQPVPDAAGRTIYRIVQEGITNARKHAPGTVLTVRVAGSPDEGIDVVLRNPLGFESGTTPGAGLGLIGLEERAELRGGHLTAGRDRSTFVVHAWIPWGS